MTLCPACNVNQSVEGDLMVAGSEDGYAKDFYPKGLRFFALRRSVRLSKEQGFTACLNCGHVWGKLNPNELSELIARSRK